MAEVFEFSDEIVVTLEMPPAAEEAVSVSVEGALLVISSERDPAFHTEIALPGAVAADRMQISYEGNTLRVTLPKAR
jgi:HSP20 family molecular chaperone IbpA